MKKLKKRDGIRRVRRAPERNTVDVMRSGLAHAARLTVANVLETERLNRVEEPARKTCTPRSRRPPASE
jgi:hypothetical protein